MTKQNSPDFPSSPLPLRDAPQSGEFSFDIDSLIKRVKLSRYGPLEEEMCFFDPNELSAFGGIRIGDHP